jgi:nucleotide-binding universal stress UspA family protein
MCTFDHILCLLSEASSTAAALQQALYLAGSFGAPLHVGSIGGLRTPTIRDVLDGLGPSSSRSEPPPTVSVPLTGPHVSADDVQHVVEGLGATLVVTDTPADRGPVPPLSSAATQSLLQGLDCSVFVVERSTPLPALDHLLVPTDLSEQTRPALHCAAHLASFCDATVHLLHVIEVVPYVALTRTDRLSFGGSSLPETRARRRMAAFLDDGPSYPVPVNPHFTYGDPADQIGRFLNQHDADLMVLAAHGARTQTGAAMGAIPDRLLRRVACPSLLVRPLRDAPASAVNPSMTSQDPV